MRETALKLGSGADTLPAVVGVPGTDSLPISIAQYLNLVDWTGRRIASRQARQSLPSARSGD